MYCSNCGFKLKEKHLKSIDKSNIDTAYVCPRCGHLIKKGLNEQEVRNLSAASHTEIHKARNSLNRGMCGLLIAIILLAVSTMFLMMSFKATAGGALVTNCMEFYTFILTITFGVGSLVYGILHFVIGVVNLRVYNHLLKDIANDVFEQ